MGRQSTSRGTWLFSQFEAGSPALSLLGFRWGSGVPTGVPGSTGSPLTSRQSLSSKSDESSSGCNSRRLLHPVVAMLSRCRKLISGCARPSFSSSQHVKRFAVTPFSMRGLLIGSRCKSSPYAKLGTRVIGPGWRRLE